MADDASTDAATAGEGDGHGFPVPPDGQMMQLLMSVWLVQGVCVLAELGVPAALAAGPRPVADVAAEVGAHPRTLYRLLRALAEIGVVREIDGGEAGGAGGGEAGPRAWALTPLGRTLVPGEPGSLTNLAIMTGSAWQRELWSGLLSTVRTGRPSMLSLDESGLFGYLGSHPEDAAVFNAAMVEAAAGSTAAVAAGYDFGRFGTLVDVGGGHGYLLGAVLSRHEGVSGVLFDLPEVVSGAATNLARLGVANRCRLAAGSFFTSVPAGADGYLVSHVIHDWPDDKALILLRTVRAAMKDDATLLIAEWVLPDGPEPAPVGKFLDLQMLVSTDDGRERTLAEHVALLEAAGLRLVATHAGGPGRPSLLEAVPA